MNETITIASLHAAYTLEEYLENYRFLDLLLQQKEDEIDKYSAIREGLVSTLKPTGRVQETKRNKREELYVYYHDLIMEIEKDAIKYIQYYKAIKRDIETNVDKLSSFEQIVLIKAKYFEGKTYEVIAGEMNYADRTVYRKVNQALGELASIMQMRRKK